ncbi:hypothetical protein [Actinomadura algeriensis]|uniref:Tryptophan 2,3-dioxygenase n=1 Tax=Actinomadura algeriensis TaxID=1679523 RepID=A0ABR9JTK6_9ACTN|nr:hypothetical protein [Actinomadura algeriensis]MBE1533904.1 tryptophan 2,3-dioxygenase [Actinomadura algeriensis]
MRHTATIKEVLDFDVAAYVAAARATGRQHLDPAMRGRMAELYLDVRDVLARPDTPAGGRERRVLRLAELVLQSEWKLAGGGEETARDAAGRAFPRGATGPGPRGKRYQPYGNVRLLNHVLGTSRHASDVTIEHRCRRALAFLVSSWDGYERRSAAGAETWGGQDRPADEAIGERLRRLAAIAAAIGEEPAPCAAVPAPRWERYLGADGRPNVLEYLVNLPQTRKHEENTFLRVIHLTEVTTWAILARTVAANGWLTAGRWAPAARCLEAAAETAALQHEIMLVLRRTMSVEHFLGFREETGNASAVQMASAQTLHIHLLGVHPAKVEALGGIEENAYLLLYLNRRFRPLRALLADLPRGDERAARVLAAARTLDERLWQWRRLHLGLAYRYLPREVKGSGGTDGAPYLAGFYHDRLFDEDGEVHPQPVPVAMPPVAGWVRARPVFSPLN